jgi:alpha-D-ribose 1-methylphosphonate 5-triphosphate synthase subunit PhnL
LSALTSTGPALDINKLDQIAALPLGGRVKLNAWDDKVELSKAAPVAIVTARDKMPFEVTPFFPRLSRVTATEVPVNQTASAAAPADQAGTANHAPLNPGTR